MLWLYVLVVILSASLDLTLSGPTAERVVYPRLLQARGANGEKLLHIQNGLTLHLEKTSVLAENFTITTFEGGNQIHSTMNGKNLEKNVYRDRSQAAAVSVEEQDGTLEVRGALSPKLRIAPSPLKARSEDGQMAHEIFEIEQHGDFRSDYIVPPSLKVQERTVVYRNKYTRVPVNFTVEVAILIDKFLYKEFKNDSHIVPYLAMILTLINLRYDDTHDPYIQFVLTQVFLGKNGDPVSQTMYEYDVKKPSGPNKLYMQSDITVSRLAKAVQYGVLDTTADMMILVTGLDLADKEGDVVENAVLGIAYLGAVCSASLRAALAEDHAYTFSTVGVTAHELAHALGSVHDGDQPIYATVGKRVSGCNARDEYTMAPVAGGKNFGKFSTCSLNQLSSFAGTLSQRCFNISVSSTFTMPTKPIPGTKWNPFPGRALDKTFYCKSLYANSWRVTARDHLAYAPRCKLLCCPSAYGGCYVHDMVDGMTCGDQKVCMRHVCARPGEHPASPPRRATTATPTRNYGRYYYWGRRSG
ncbi:venom metalloproteinase antarease-like TtrivMP_A [Ixodes scapularis]|uniref:venom metalloproteinase antarease-like TtrivMP_A n=1 Tax=Ixodes scapularis TaxID=6945 RepID=UPI001C388C75|nr:venom metalloproteinase antarease-like TtrivMP_A [Ixodes scapularis]